MTDRKFCLHTDLTRVNVYGWTILWRCDNCGREFDLRDAINEPLGTKDASTEVVEK